jgi:hypothetical protein
MHTLMQWLTVIAGLLIGTAALACGQVGPIKAAGPGATIEIRGYGYGFEGGDRPVILKWLADRTVAAATQIDGNGDFVASIKAPAEPGLHVLRVMQGTADSAPVEVTVPVVAPWYWRMVVAVQAAPAALIIALALALFASGGVYLHHRHRVARA